MENDWDKGETMNAIEAAMHKGLIEEITSSGNVACRESQKDTQKATFREKDTSILMQNQMTVVRANMMSLKEASLNEVVNLLCEIGPNHFTLQCDHDLLAKGASRRMYETLSTYLE